MSWLNFFRLEDDSNITTVKANTLCDPFKNIDTSLLEQSNVELEEATMELKKHAFEIVQDLRRDSTQSFINQIFLFSQQINDAVIILDSNGRIIFANNSTESLFGWEMTELKHKSLEYLLLDASKNFLYLEQARQLSENITHKIHETIGIHKNGTRIEINLSISSFTTMDNSKLFSVIIRDITSRKKDENKLKKSESMYRNFIEQSHNGMFIIEKEKFIVANTALCKIFGYSMDEILHNVTCYDIIQETDKDTIREKFKECLKDNSITMDMTFKGITKKESIMFGKLICNVIKVCEEDGEEKIWTVGTIIDTTDEEKERKERLREHLCFQSLFENSIMGIMITDDKGLIHNVNEYMCKIFGFSINELKGNHFTSFIQEEDRFTFQEEYNKAFKENINTIKKYVIKTRNGSKKEMIFDCKNIKYETKTLRISTIIDISSFKELI